MIIVLYIFKMFFFLLYFFEVSNIIIVLLVLDVFILFLFGYFMFILDWRSNSYIKYNVIFVVYVLEVICYINIIDLFIILLCI